MNPRVFHVRQRSEIERVAQDIAWRLKIGGTVEVFVADPGESDERSRWMRRYHKLVALIAEHVVQDGARFSPKVWDLALKDMFLTATELRLPNGKVILDRPLKREMNRADRDAFLEQVQEFAAAEGVFLQQPETEGV